MTNLVSQEQHKQISYQGC